MTVFHVVCYSSSSSFVYASINCCLDQNLLCGTS